MRSPHGDPVPLQKSLRPAGHMTKVSLTISGCTVSCRVPSWPVGLKTIMPSAARGSYPSKRLGMVRVFIVRDC